MELTERPGEYRPIPYYINVEPEYVDFKDDIRVLPAPFYFEKRLLFTFKRRHEPGTKGWPTGGYECRGPSGEFRAFEFDQIIIHPDIFETRKRMDKIRKRQEKEEIKRQKKIDKIQKNQQTNSSFKKGKGRPKLSEEEKLKRKVERETNPTPDGTGRKGRKPLSKDERIKREAAKLVRQKLTGGKRGRPLNPDKKAERERQQQLRIERNPDRKRGRPKKS
jgi:hypothetical protein